MISASSSLNSWQVVLFKASQQRRIWQRNKVHVLKVRYMNEGSLHHECYVYTE